MQKIFRELGIFILEMYFLFFINSLLNLFLIYILKINLIIILLVNFLLIFIIFKLTVYFSLNLFKNLLIENDKEVKIFTRNILLSIFIFNSILFNFNIEINNYILFILFILFSYFAIICAFFLKSLVKLDKMGEI